MPRQGEVNDAGRKLKCLKCDGTMRTYERNGIVIDQCTVCHGVFLDRGELERLIGVESAFLAGAAPRGGGQSQGGTRRKPAGRGFLGELFD